MNFSVTKGSKKSCSNQSQIWYAKLIKINDVEYEQGRRERRREIEKIGREREREKEKKRERERERKKERERERETERMGEKSLTVIIMSVISSLLMRFLISSTF